MIKAMRILREILRWLKEILKWLFALIFITAGILHFVLSDSFVRIVPPILPFPLLLVYLSGICEIALGALLLIRKCSAYAAWGLIGLLIAVYPANIYMAMNPDLFPQFSQSDLYWRLPLQLVLIMWASFYTRTAVPPEAEREVPPEAEEKTLEDLPNETD